MAKDSKAAKLPVPGFRDVPKEAVDRAAAALAGGRQDPLTVPKNAAVSVDNKGIERKRWTETVLITDAYRSVTKSNLMDVVIKGKIRQSKTKENTGKRVFGHFYMNMQAQISEEHAAMNDRSLGAIRTFLIPLGLMPGNGALGGSLLNKLFPQQNSPGAKSPLLEKVVTVTICQALEPKKDKNRKVVLDEDGDEILIKRDQMEAALPPVAAPEEDEDEDDEEDEDSASDDDSDDAEEDESDDDDESEDDDEEDGDDEDEDAEDDDDEDEEEEEPAPAPAKKSRRK